MKHDSEVLIATLMRPVGGSGVQSHARTVTGQLSKWDEPSRLVTPFDSLSILMAPAFAARYALRPVSRGSAVWWYRTGHAHYLADALRKRLAAVRRDGRRAVIYAQCPVSAAVALRLRTDEAVVLAVHFNISQAEEWADKGEIQRDGRVFRSIRKLEADVFPRVDGLVFVSEFSRRIVYERIAGSQAVPSVVVPNAVPVREAPAVVPTSDDLLTVGSLEPRKNQGYLLEVLRAAAQRGHRYRLTVLGDGPDLSSLQTQARCLGLADEVAFHGHHDNPRALMASHRIYCHTATMESFGIVLAEAMSEGLPVLAGAVGGIPEVVRHGIEGEHWPLDDPDAAAEQLICLMENRDRRAAMSVAARERARSVFAPEVQVTRLHAFLMDRAATAGARDSRRCHTERLC